MDFAEEFLGVLTVLNIGRPVPRQQIAVDLVDRGLQEHEFGLLGLIGMHSFDELVDIV